MLAAFRAPQAGIAETSGSVVVGADSGFWVDRLTMVMGYQEVQTNWGIFVTSVLHG